MHCNGITHASHTPRQQMTLAHRHDVSTSPLMWPTNFSHYSLGNHPRLLHSIHLPHLWASTANPVWDPTSAAPLVSTLYVFSALPHTQPPLGCIELRMFEGRHSLGSTHHICRHNYLMAAPFSFPDAVLQANGV